MDWNNIKGHEDNINMLKVMLATGRMPHALLFTGPQGIGKRTIAQITAKAILCSGVSAQKPCGCCESCKLSARDAHPDLLIINPEGNSIKIDQIRLLNQEASKAPHMNEARACIIKDAGRMTLQAQNSLLKLLEEPPAGFVFILTTESARSLLSTILSRCRLLRFNPLNYGILAEILKEKGFPVQISKVAARLGGGRMGVALELAAADGFAMRDRAAAIVSALPQKKHNMLWDNAAIFDKMGSKDIKMLLKYLLYIFRDLYLLAAGQQQQLIINIDMLEELVRQVAYWDETAILGAINEVREAERAFNANANVRLTSEALIINLMNWAQRGKSFADSSRGAL